MSDPKKKALKGIRDAKKQQTTKDEQDVEVASPASVAQEMPRVPLKAALDRQQTYNDDQYGRKKQIKDLMDRYEQANRVRSFRSRNTGTGALSIALSNPAAAQAYSQGRKNYQNQPVDDIVGAQNASQQRINTNKGVSAQQQTDSEMDRNSTVSIMYKQQLRKNGIDVPDTASAADIKKVFPFIQLDTKRDAQVRGQDVVAETADQNRASRQSQKAKDRGVKVSQGDKNRGVKVSEGDANRRAGVGKIILGGTLQQQLAASRGTSGGQQRTANAATIPHAFAGDKFLTSKPGIPPDEKRGRDVAEKGGQARKYQAYLQRVKSLVQQANGRPDIFDANWPAIKSAFTQATQGNIKAMGNGVANGADIEQAILAIGNPNDAVTYLRGGLLQKIDEAMRSIPEQYLVFADSQGYALSDKPSQISTSGGTGGSQSSKKPVNPASAGSANDVAKTYGFQPPISDPGTPDIPQKIDKKTDDALKAMGF